MKLPQKERTEALAIITRSKWENMFQNIKEKGEPSVMGSHHLWNMTLEGFILRNVINGISHAVREIRLQWHVQCRYPFLQLILKLMTQNLHRKYLPNSMTTKSVNSAEQMQSSSMLGRGFGQTKEVRKTRELKFVNLWWQTCESYRHYAIFKQQHQMHGSGPLKKGNATDMFERGHFKVLSDAITVYTTDEDSGEFKSGLKMGLYYLIKRAK